MMLIPFLMSDHLCTLSLKEVIHLLDMGSNNFVAASLRALSCL